SATPQPDEVPAEPRPVETTVHLASVTASQMPNITALVSDAAKASGIPAPTSPAAAEAARDGSVSPGGTKRTAPPQDIPSEKLGFREDKRALSMLDRAFARV
ncbi:MAG: hypothetical protein M1823_008196, partial [Watsoniomyces obsoletus]